MLRPNQMSRKRLGEAMTWCALAGSSCDLSASQRLIDSASRTASPESRISPCLCGVAKPINARTLPDQRATGFMVGLQGLACKIMVKSLSSINILTAALSKQLYAGVRLGDGLAAWYTGSSHIPSPRPSRLSSPPTPDDSAISSQGRLHVVLVS